MTLFGQIVQNVQHEVKNNLGMILFFNPKSKDVGNPEKIMHRGKKHYKICLKITLLGTIYLNKI